MSLTGPSEGVFKMSLTGPSGGGRANGQPLFRKMTIADGCVAWFIRPPDEFEDTLSEIGTSIVICPIPGPSCWQLDSLRHLSRM
jgi:hypothetical protein